MIVTNVATKQTDKGVAPQSPLEESATASARWPVRNRVTFGVVYAKLQPLHLPQVMKIKHRKEMGVYKVIGPRTLWDLASEIP